jgi:hypothetical protein
VQEPEDDEDPCEIDISLCGHLFKAGSNKDSHEILVEFEKYKVNYD